MRLHSVEMLYLLWLLPVLGGLFLYSSSRRKQLLAGFVAPGLQEKLAVASPVRRGWKAVLILAGFALLVTGLARPAWNLQQTTITRKGRDVVFVLAPSCGATASAFWYFPAARQSSALSPWITAFSG
jgi:hypothetical protein